MNTLRIEAETPPQPQLMAAPPNQGREKSSDDGSRQQEAVLRLECETPPLMITRHGTEQSQQPGRQATSSPTPKATSQRNVKEQAQGKEEGALLLTNGPAKAGARPPQRRERSADDSRQEEVLRLEYEAPLMITRPVTEKSETCRQLATSPAPEATRQHNSNDQTQEKEEGALLLTNGPAKAKAKARPPPQSSLDRERERQQILQRTLQRERKRRKDEAAVVSAYADFFNHISLRRGWKTAPFELEPIRPLLTTAASIVVKLRHELDEADTGFKMRQVDGSARDFMWSVTEDPSTCPRRSGTFIRHTVHATFRDRSGYVEGLTAERVEKEIDNFLGPAEV